MMDNNINLAFDQKTRSPVACFKLIVLASLLNAHRNYAFLARKRSPTKNTPDKTRQLEVENLLWFIDKSDSI